MHPCKCEGKGYREICPGLGRICRCKSGAELFEKLLTGLPQVRARTRQTSPAEIDAQSQGTSDPLPATAGSLV